MTAPAFDPGRGSRRWAFVVALAAALATPATAQEPDYLLARPRLDCLGRPCRPFRIVDLTLEREPEGAAGGLRFTLGGRWLLGITAGPGERGGELRTSRLRLRGVERDDGSATADAEWRGGRWEVRAAGSRRSDRAGGGWQLVTALGYRPSPRLKLLAEFERDLQARPPLLFEERPWGRGRLGVLWQSGPRLELAAGVDYTRLRAGLGERLERRGVDARAVWQRSRLRTHLGVRFEDEQGRFDRRDILAGLRLDLLTFDRVVATVAVTEHVELGRVERSRELTGGLELFGRDYRFERAGAAAAALEELVDLAWEEGYGLDRAYDLEGLRDLREGLALADRPRLDPALERLHAAQIDDRRVGQLALRWRSLQRPDVGRSLLRIDGTIGIPWPLAWPWSASAARVELARATFRYEEANFGFDVIEIGRGVTVDLWPHRELGLRMDWQQPVRTPLDVALGRGSDDRWTVATRYVWGR